MFTAINEQGQNTGIFANPFEHADGLKALFAARGYAKVYAMTDADEAAANAIITPADPWNEDGTRKPFGRIEFENGSYKAYNPAGNLAETFTAIEVYTRQEGGA